jgi:hypothetical protein
MKWLFLIALAIVMLGSAYVVGSSLNTATNLSHMVEERTPDDGN